MTPEAKPPSLDEESSKLLLTHLKGISSVTLRIVGTDSRIEASIKAFLQARGMLVDVVHLERIVPPPLRRFSFQYSGRSAILTVSPGANLKG